MYDSWSIFFRLDKEEKGEFRYSILSEKDRDKYVRIEDYPCIYICTNGYYYDTYPGIMLFNRLKRNYLWYNLSFDYCCKIKFVPLRELSAISFIFLSSFITFNYEWWVNLTILIFLFLTWAILSSISLICSSNRSIFNKFLNSEKWFFIITC